MNIYAISRGSELRALARHANFDAPFEIVHPSSMVERRPFKYRIIPDVYRCIGPDGVNFARIRDGFFFNNPGGGGDILECGLFYVTPHYFNERCNLDRYSEVLRARNYTLPNLIPSRWREEKVDNAYFGGDTVILYGQRVDEHYGVMLDFWSLREAA